MELHVYAAFVVATIIMISLPGPSVLLTVAHSLSFGWRRALFTVAGETAGIAVQLFVVAIGLASLLQAVAEVFEWLRWAGVVYLVYLGIKQWREAAHVTLDADPQTKTRTNVFVQGLAVTIPNPKSLVFIAAFLPQFIDSTRPLGQQFVVMVPTFLVITFVFTSAWAVAAGKARGFLKSQRAFRTVLRSSGGLMVVAGVGLAMARRSS
jgi:homoserine/homoserine lactone efflux protein